jgi:hypothetical protein
MFQDHNFLDTTLMYSWKSNCTVKKNLFEGTFSENLHNNRGIDTPDFFQFLLFYRLCLFWSSYGREDGNTDFFIFLTKSGRCCEYI